MRRRTILSLVAVAALLVTAFGMAVGASARQDELSAVKAATAQFDSIRQATRAGYGPFYMCTEQPGVGTMGQHYVNLALAGDPAVDALRPEVLVYAPKRDGQLRLVGVEYVTFDTSAQPSVLGQPMLFRAAGNRYGLPDFYERHAWIWQGNPLGTFNDWNPDISCLGNGDNGG